MLLRASLLLVAIGITAVTAASYNTDYRTDGYGRTDRTYNDRNYPRNEQNFDRRGPFDQYSNPQNYNQNSGGSNYDFNNNNNNNNNNNRDYTNRQNNNGNSNVYTKNETAIFCYINATRLDHTRSQYGSGGPAMEIEPRLCTHLIIGAATLHQNRVTLTSSDILSRQGIGLLSYDKISELRRENPHLKVLLSIHGTSEEWSHALRSNRDTLVKNIGDICRNNRVGVNIDYQWPERRRDHQVEDFFQFLLELKNELRGISAQSHELSVFLPAEYQQLLDILQPRSGNQNVNIDLMMEYVDYWILMAIELRGHWEQKIEHHAPIDSYTGSRTTVRRAITEVKTYAPRDFLYKFVLAIPFYGKKYQLATRSDRESPMNKLQQTLHTSYDYDGLLKIPYNMVCQEIAKSDFQLDYDETNGCPYAYHDNTVFVYEDTKSVKAKTRLALANGFGGVMAYSIEMDDATGRCSQALRHTSTNERNSYNNYASYDKYPLLNAIKDQVHRGNAAQFHSSPLAIALAVICAFILKVNN